MSSCIRKSENAHGALNTFVKQITAKRYKRALATNPRLKHCDWCRSVITTPPKAINIRMHSFKGAPKNRVDCTFVICQGCIQFKREIVQRFVGHILVRPKCEQSPMGVHT